jgi:hypothetical protein
MIQEIFCTSAISMLFIFMAAFISPGIWLGGINQFHRLRYTLLPPGCSQALRGSVLAV